MATYVGREKEVALFDKLLHSDKSEFIVVSGRRRVGKTFLVNSLYSKQYSFYYTGGHNLTNDEQLAMFAQRLSLYSKAKYKIEIQDWFEAFDYLQKYLESLPRKQRKIIFFDEMPWIDTRNSKFVKALEYFWNSWAGVRTDIFLIASGSATSWINDKLIENQGGLHNRITCRIFLEQFTLKETEEYLERRGFVWDRYTILQTYMITGGVPFYLNLLDPKLSLAQNVDELCFSKSGILRVEFNELYSALFTNADKYVAVVRALSERHYGMTRQEISAATKIQGSTLTRIVGNLEKCGFIIGYNNTGKATKDVIYRLSDFYTLFYFRFIETNSFKDKNFWSHSLQTPQINAWQGFTFELICLTHLEQVKKALGISGILTKSTSWRNKDSQIDLVIDRADRIINLCEIKFSLEKYKITKEYADHLRDRMTAFRDAIKTKKSLINTFITTYGVFQDKYSSICQSEITMDVLFD